MATYEGRLELTWTNKALRLLAGEDGGYEWASPADYRVAEVRLLHDAGTIGEVGVERAKDNLLIRGDALNALTSLIELPEFGREYVGKVKLAYLDPPFNTQQAFAQYDDALEHSVWLTMMRDRLVQVKTLLAPDGSVWVHCDDSEQAYLKVMMDEVFGRDNFVAATVWEKTDSPRMDTVGFSVRHDYILVYQRSDAFQVRTLPATDAGEHYTKVDEHGTRYYLNPLRARGRAARRQDRPTMYFPMVAPDGTEVFPRLPDGGEGRWRWGPDRYKQESDRVVWISGKQGWTAWYRIYEPENRVRPPETIWRYTEVGSTRTSANEVKSILEGRAFSTPKPERLLDRVLSIASEPGDVVLDCFLGSGTTASVAHKKRRRWVGIDRSLEAIDGFAVPRLSKVVSGEDHGGITRDVDWEGGGGFRVLDVAPSMFEEEGGQVFLSEWATNGKLAEATAAQLRYAYGYEAPFCGRRGRSRLAVVDGLVNEGVVRLLAAALAPEERLTVCGTAVDPAAGTVLKGLRPGSTVRKVPEAILRGYRRAVRWAPAASTGVVATGLDGAGTAVAEAVGS